MVLLTLPWIERKGERCYTKCIKVTMLDFQSPQDRWRHRSSFSTSCLSFKGSQNLNHFRNIRKYMYDYAYLGHNLVYAQSLLILGHLVMFIDVHELVCKTVQCLLLYNKKTKKMSATVSSLEHIVKSSWNITGFTYTHIQDTLIAFIWANWCVYKSMCIKYLYSHSNCSSRTTWRTVNIKFLGQETSIFQVLKQEVPVKE